MTVLVVRVPTGYGKTTLLTHLAHQSSDARLQNASGRVAEVPRIALI